MNWKAFAWRRTAGRDHGGVEGGAANASRLSGGAERGQNGFQVDCGTVLCGRAIETPALQTAGYVLIIAAASS
jgi:hypothetical protein